MQHNAAGQKTKVYVNVLPSLHVHTHVQYKCHIMVMDVRDVCLYYKIGSTRYCV